MYAESAAEIKPLHFDTERVELDYKIGHFVDRYFKGLRLEYLRSYVTRNAFKRYIIVVFNRENNLLGCSVGNGKSELTVGRGGLNKLMRVRFHTRIYAHDYVLRLFGML